MADFLRRHGLLLSALTLLVCSLQLMSFSVRNPSLPRMGGRVVSSVLTPANKLHHELSESVKFAWSHYVWLLSVETERNSLRERIKELESFNSRLIEFQQENTRLKQLVQFSETTGFRGVVSTVIGRDPSNWTRTVTIDRGASSGIREGLAVVDGNAIVGQTTVVTNSSSVILLLTDNLSAIDALVQGSRATGTLEGNGKHQLKLRYVEHGDDEAVKIGDRVISSGLDGVFPKGALLGVVHRVGRSSSAAFQDIEVEPSVDVNRLENVMVLLPERTETPAVLDEIISTDRRKGKKEEYFTAGGAYQCTRIVGLGGGEPKPAREAKKPEAKKSEPVKAEKKEPRKPEADVQERD